MFVEDERIAQRYMTTGLQKVHRLLYMGLTTPVVRLSQLRNQETDKCCVFMKFYHPSLLHDELPSSTLSMLICR